MVTTSAAGSAGVLASGSVSAPARPGAAIRSVVSGGQRVDGARGQRRVHSLVELGPVEAAVGDGGAQQLEDPVAFCVGRAQHGRAGRICRHAASPAT